MVATKSALIFYLVTNVCLTSGILMTKVPRDFRAVTSLPSVRYSYPATTSSTFPKVPQHEADANLAPNNGLDEIGSTGRHVAESRTNLGYFYLKPPSNNFRLPLKDQKIKSPISNHQSTFKEVEDTGLETVIKVFGRKSTTTIKPRVEAGHPLHVPRGSYQVVEENDEYLTDNSNHDRSPYRGKLPTRYPHHDSQDITTAIKALDHFLTGVLNDDSYNSELHPPPNPVLSLVLSRYGRYVPGLRNPRIYANMAVNNIHNNQPFGKYKQECEEEPNYIGR